MIVPGRKYSKNKHYLNLGMSQPPQGIGKNSKVLNSNYAVTTVANCIYKIFIKIFEVHGSAVESTPAKPKFNGSIPSRTLSISASLPVWV